MRRPGAIVGRRLLPAIHTLGRGVGQPVNAARLLRWSGYAVGRGASVCCYAVADDVEISDDVTVGANVVLGRGVRLGAGSRIIEGSQLSDAVIGAATRVEMGCLLARFEVGARSWIGAQTMCVGRGDGRITIGEGAYIGPRCLLDWTGGLVMGSGVQVSGPSTVFWTHSSADQMLSGLAYDSAEGRRTAPITVGDHVFIGGNCTIYPGVTIGDHSIVLPNSVVGDDVAAYRMVGGAPATVVKELEQRPRR